MLNLKDISCGYGLKKILNSISFEIKEGTTTTFLGANGTGKSTLLKAIVGLLTYSGNLFLKGEEVRKIPVKKRAKLLAYVPQSTNIPFDFTVLEVVLMGRFHASKLSLNYSKSDFKIAQGSLERVGIGDFTNRVYRLLSGGERQLVLLARAIAQQSQLIVMDEPITGLDLGNQMRLLLLIDSLKNEGYTLIKTTHYPDHALRVSDQVVWIGEGKILASGYAKEVINIKRLKEVYGVESECYDHPSGQRFILPLRFMENKI